MSDLISRQALCEYALNQKDKSVTPNDIMRFPSAQPEPCEDAVSREAVIAKLKDMRKHGDMIPWEGKRVFEAIRHLPSAQPERKNGKWIPCSERLPHGSCSDLVNVSIHDDSGDTPFDYTSCGWVTTDGEYWIVDNEINNHVIAWMPLPEPYRGESDV